MVDHSRSQVVADLLREFAWIAPAVASKYARRLPVGLCVDDARQIALVTIWRIAVLVAGGRELRDVRSFMVRCAHYRVRNLVHANRGRGLKFIPTKAAPAVCNECSAGEGVPLAEQAVAREEVEPNGGLNPILRRALKRLTDRQRYILLTHAVEDKPFVEIATEIGVSATTVSTLFHDSVAAIRAVPEMQYV